MATEVKGKWYSATIEKSKVNGSDGTLLDFRVEISCKDGETFKELIEYIEAFHN